TPREAWEKRIDIVQKDKEDPAERERTKFQIGQWVSILGPDLGTLSHKYRGQWTLSKFKIVRVDTSKPRTFYYVEDELGEPLKNGFYSEEMTPARFTPFKRVEKVLKRKTVDGVKMSLVRYKK